jgi:hypothetical protein
VPAVPTAVEAVAATVQTVVGALSLVVQPAVYMIAARCQAIGRAYMAVVIGPGSALVIAGFYPVAFEVEPLFHPVAPAVQAVVDTVAEVAGGSGAGDAQQQCGEQQHGFAFHRVVLGVVGSGKETPFPANG